MPWFLREVYLFLYNLFEFFSYRMKIFSAYRQIIRRGGWWRWWFYTFMNFFWGHLHSDSHKFLLFLPACCCLLLTYYSFSSHGVCVYMLKPRDENANNKRKINFRWNDFANFEHKKEWISDDRKTREIEAIPNRLCDENFHR